MSDRGFAADDKYVVQRQHINETEQYLPVTDSSNWPTEESGGNLTDALFATNHSAVFDITSNMLDQPYSINSASNFNYL